MKIFFCILWSVILLSCLSSSLFAQSSEAQINIPLGGNAWVHGGHPQITNDGLVDWKDAASATTIYFYAADAGSVNVALRLASATGKCDLQLTINGQKHNKQVNPNDKVIDFGRFNIIQKGYVKVQLQGLSKSGAAFPNVTDLMLSGSLVPKIEYVKNNDGNFFHWGRRGPSVHLNYSLPAEAKDDAEWFYTEITVPKGMDKIGSYFMADGFSGGYFGMQVNSATERRVLFSVWSPQVTDDPKDIVDSMRVRLLRKGATVHGGDFGNEGAGGQSYLQYSWKADHTYAFLLHAQPDSTTHSTAYTAYFKDKQDSNWQLIASFKRPQTLAYLNHLYSFLENFERDMGDQSRMALYGNQWVGDKYGKWYPLLQAIFTGDNTANQRYRLDYAGGVAANGALYLRNGGFFNDATTLKQTFQRTDKGDAPAIHIQQLP